MELKTEFRRNVRIRALFPWQDDVQAHALAAGFIGAAIGGLHEAGTAAGNHHHVAVTLL